MKTIFDIYTKEEIENKIKEITQFINKGLKDKEIKENIGGELIEELISIARARIKANKKISKYTGKVLYFNLEDLRFSTPKIIADYRAKFLSCDKIVDLCCGVGFQSFAFSKTCKEVYSFDIDERKIKYAKENFPFAENIEFIKGDVLSEEIIKKIEEIYPDIIFCDPERFDFEKERKIETIKPHIEKIINIYSKITKNICIELPPQIDLSKLKKLGDFEAEYLSFRKKINRLNIYFGDLKRAKISCSEVTTLARLENSNEELEIKKSKIPLSYIYEVSEAIKKAGLEKEFSFEINAFILEGTEKGKLIMTNNEIYENDVFDFCNIFKKIAETETLEELKENLKKYNFKKAIIKYSIDPKNYWKERNYLEEDLKGNKEATIFVYYDNLGRKKYLITEEVKIKKE